MKVKKDFYVSNEALQAKLKAGARGFDLRRRPATWCRSSPRKTC